MPRPLSPRLLATAGLFVAAAVTDAAAFDRYADRTAVPLAPQAAEPWLTQLRARPVSYRDVTGPVTVAAPSSRFAPIQTVRSAAVEPSETRRPAHGVDPRFLPTEVEYRGTHPAGTIVVDTSERHLYLVQGEGKALRYGVGVGRPGFQWSGTQQITRKAEWPDWRPPPAMLKRKPDLPRYMAGGPENPLGARALYLGSTEYRIHGSNEPWTIGQAVSSGCIRMRNEDVSDLYGRVKVGTRVVVM